MGGGIGGREEVEGGGIGGCCWCSLGVVVETWAEVAKVVLWVWSWVRVGHLRFQHRLLAAIVVHALDCERHELAAHAALAHAAVHLRKRRRVLSVCSRGGERACACIAARVHAWQRRQAGGRARPTTPQGSAAPQASQCSHAWLGSCGVHLACTRCSQPPAPLALGPRRQPPPWPARPRGSRGWASC